jgi:hypothetical protein
MPLSLYATLLGPAWMSVAPSVRRLHAGGARARGVFRVRRGEGFLARLVAALLRLPAAGEGVAITLAVDPAAGGERWSRTFGGRILRSFQWQSGALLAEALGLVQCLFELRVEAGALVFAQVRATMGFRRLALPLPRVLSPRVEGRAEADGDEVLVDVQIHAPLVGLLIRYDGRCAAEPAS